MSTNLQRRFEDGALINLEGTWVSYEGMFDDVLSIADRYSSLKTAATNVTSIAKSSTSHTQSASC